MRSNGLFGISMVGAVLVGSAAGCSASHDRGEASIGQTGTLAVALTGTSASGTTYHLTNAVFEVQNFAVFPPIDLVVPGDEPTLDIDLPPSVFPFDYFILLRDGWTLNSVNADGTEQPVSATLLNNFISFTIKSQRTTPVVFPFKAGDEVVTTGNGTVGVSITVDDTLLDDFEDGDGLVATLGGRNGAWFAFNDGTGTVTPAPNTPIVPEVLDTSASFLLHMTGENLAPLGTLLPDGSSAFGAGVGASLLFDATLGITLPYDASKYSGLDFTFATKSLQSSLMQVSFLIGTSATTPVEFGGTCTSNCFDDFGFVGTVPPGDFSFIGGFDWGQLTQQGFGTPATFDPATILTVKFIVGFINIGQSPASDVFDFRLDDLSFRPSLGLSSSATRPGAMDAGQRFTPDQTSGPLVRRSWAR